MPPFAYALRRPLLATLGTLALVAGIVGIFVPLLPTTPFLLVSAACYARSSRRMHAWLLGHRRLGPCIRAFEQGRALPRRAKALAAGTLWASMAFAIPALPAFAGQVAMLGMAIAVTAWIVAMPTSGDTVREGS